MIEHSFICDDCHIELKDTDTKDTHYCPRCGQAMYWDLRGIGIAQGDYHHISDSLAIHPDQAAEHREMFPEVGVLPDGRLEFDSIRVQERYAEKCGFYKKPRRSKGRKLV
jgi:hypothetical protein